jgi:glycosyl-4,4'-diaponeurosporenoate acyltransferase
MADLVCMVRVRFLKENLLIFILFSLVMTIVCEKIPIKVYNYKKWLFRERKWEHGGHIYEHIFRVKRWKSNLPDISDFMKWRFNKKHLAESSSDYLSVFLTESCKSEFTHWMIIFSTLLFQLWSDLISTLLIFILAFILNLPYIIIQRYNRPRLIRLLRRANVGRYGQEVSVAKI